MSRKPKNLDPNGTLIETKEEGSYQKPTTAAGLERAADASAEVLSPELQGVIVNGWMFNLELGHYSEYFARGLSAWVGGAGANAPEEAVYPRSAFDDQGEKPASNRKYQIRFEPNCLPPVKAFWSISMYGSDQNPVKNEIDRISISNRTEGIQPGQDESLTIYIQSTERRPCPAHLEHRHA